MKKMLQVRTRRTSERKSHSPISVQITKLFATNDSRTNQGFKFCNQSFKDLYFNKIQK